MFKIYKASAGAGKTTNLVKEYLLLCLKDLSNYKHILAVTFTNNATAEMKERILNILYDFSFCDAESFAGSTKFIAEEMVKALYCNGRLDRSAENPELLEQAYNRLKSNPDEWKAAYAKLQEQSRKLLENILYDYSNFSISTIDSFFQRVIRAFALELGINLNFSIQIELDEVYQQTLDTLLNRISDQDAQLANRVLALVGQELDESGKLQIESDLLEVIDYLQKEKCFLPMSYLQRQGYGKLQQLKNKLEAKRTDLQTAIHEMAWEANELMAARPSSDFHKGMNGIYSFFGKILKDPTTLPGYGNIESAINEKGSFTKEPDDELFEKLKSAYEFMRLNVPKMNLFDDILRNFKRIGLLLDLKEIMDEIKERDNLFYLAETNAKIYNEIRDEESPYIYEKLGNKYAYFFIDEFQDTSKMQWDDFIPLLKNALSQSASYIKSNTAKTDETGDVILFGDVKQAIYRFRNGDASLLQNLSRKDGTQYAKMRYGHEMEVGKPEFDLTELKANRRSSRAVITFNNAFFKFLSGNSEAFPGAASFYDDVQQTIPEDNGKKGLVSVRFRNQDPETSWGDFVVQAVYDAVLDAFRNRHYDFRDIAVLSSSNAQTNMLGRYLAERNIPVVSKESLLLSSSRKVQFLIAMLTCLAHPDDSVSKLIILRYLQDEGFFSESLSALLDKLNEGVEFETILHSVKTETDMRLWQTLPLLTSLKEICRIFDLNATQDAFLVAFFNAVLAEWPLGNENVLTFLDWWEEKSPKLAIASSKAVDAVTLCTVHSSKGLEYPVMIFPMEKYNTSFGKHGSKNLFWVNNPDYDISKDDSELAYYLLSLTKTLTQDTDYEQVWADEQMFAKMDSLNMLYVAQTRARDVMYILTNPKPDSSEQKVAEGKKASSKKQSLNYPELLFEFIQNPAFSEKDAEGNDINIAFEQDAENPNIYWFGDRHCEKQGTSSETAKSELPSFDFSSFSPENWLLDTSKNSSPQQEKGIYIHDFLSALPEFPQDENELQTCLKNVLPLYVGDVEAALRKIMEDVSLKPYFDKNVKTLNERNIGFMSKGELVVKRPDRLVFCGDEVMVIDYKTGTPKENDELQIQEYCGLLRQMGYEKVNYKILYF